MKFIMRLLFWTLPGLCAFFPGFGRDSALLAERGKLDFVFYGGQFADNDLHSIVLDLKNHPRESYLLAGALNYQLEARLRNIQFETETQVVKHFGEMGHMELNGVLIARGLRFIPGLPLTLAFGEGLSFATANPELENPRDLLGQRLERSRPLLNYLLIELDYPLENYQNDTRVFFRIHHRSGVFGLYCPPTCGSNFLTYGVKFSL